MRNEFRKMFSIVKLLLVFSTLTILFYGVIMWVGEKVNQNDRYAPPKGRAVKVIDIHNVERMKTVTDMKNRLLFYYWFGE